MDQQTAPSTNTTQTTPPAPLPNGGTHPKPTRGERTRTLVTLGIMAALAYVVMFFGRIPTGFLFLKYDPKDVVIAIAGFIYGPVPAFLVSLTVSFVEMFTASETGFYGMVMNVLATCAFVCPAAFVYKKRPRISGAVTGLAIGIVLMTGVMLLWNYLLTPIYMGLPRGDVAAMLSTVFLPFNLLKGFLNAALTMLLYKPVVGALRKTGRIPGGRQAAPAAGAGKIKAGPTLAAAVVLATCVLILLVMNGII